MLTLKNYVAEKNKWGAIFGQRPLDLANANDRQEIAEALDCDLSPENLSCDGELPAGQVRARYARLSKAAAELMKLDPAIVVYEA